MRAKLSGISGQKHISRSDSGLRGWALATGRPLLVGMVLLIACSVEPTAAQSPEQEKTGTVSHSASNNPAAAGPVREFDFESEVNSLRTMSERIQGTQPGGSHATIMLVLTLLAAGIVVFVKFGPTITGFVEGRLSMARAEERAYSSFAASFRAGPTVSSGKPPPVVGTLLPINPADYAIADRSPATCSSPAPLISRGINAAEPQSLPISKPEGLREFPAIVSKELARAKQVLSELDRAVDQLVRQNLVSELFDPISTLKNRAALPQLVPFWQTASALEALLKQLCDNPVNINPSTIQTVSQAMDLLGALSTPGLKADLVTNPPVRLLAVDDDAICRYAISFALKKALVPPDLANEAKTAMELAGKQSYEAIFLDVEMPGMNGFDLCSKIHGTPCNRDTPVIFITRHSDFGTRARSAMTGGQDLIGKPFLTFEVAVKALTIILRGRLPKPKCAPELVVRA